MTAGEGEPLPSLLIDISTTASTEETARARWRELLVDSRDGGRMQCARVASGAASERRSATDALTKLLTHRNPASSCGEYRCCTSSF